MLRNPSDSPLYPKRMKKVFRTFVLDAKYAYNYRTFTSFTFTFYLDHGLYTSAVYKTPDALNQVSMSPV